MRPPLPLLILLLLFSCSTREKPLLLTGTVEIREIEIAPEVPGKIVALPREEGERVEVGEVLVLLDQEPYALRVEEGRSRLRSLEASERALLAERTQRERERKRLQALLAEGGVGRAQVEDLETALMVLEQRLQALAAERRAGEFALSRFQKELASTRILSPITGVVIERLREPGEVVAPGTPILVLGDPEHPWVRTYLPETYMGWVTVGTQAEIISDAMRDAPIPARITFISPEAEFTPKTLVTQEERVKMVYRITVTPLLPRPPLGAGQYVEVRIFPPPRNKRAHKDEG